MQQSLKHRKTLGPAWNDMAAFGKDVYSWRKNYIVGARRGLYGVSRVRKCVGVRYLG